MDLQVGRTHFPKQSGMKTYWKIWRASLLLSCGLFGWLVAHGQNAPVLTIVGGTEPQISVQGAPGLNYQLQYASNLNAAVWHALTNFTMGSGPFGFADHAAVSNQVRLYRALLLDTNATVSYAPELINAGEIFRFTFSPSGFPTELISETLVLNSSTNALLLRQVMEPGISPPVEMLYQRVSAFAAQLTVIQPRSGFPTSLTNYYTLYFTGTNTGFYQASDGMIFQKTGQFTLNQSLIGQQLAPPNITAGQVILLTTTNVPAVKLVVDSVNAGVLVQPRFFGIGGLITSVDLRYQGLGPLAGQLEVVILEGASFPQTNTYWLVYQSVNSGTVTYQVSSPFPSSGHGSFSREDNFVGHQVAPLQLEAGEIYDLTNLKLVLNSSSNAMIVMQNTNSPNPANTGVFPVDLQYTVRGPLHCQLDVVMPPIAGNPSPQTNSYTLVYASSNGGDSRFTWMLQNMVVTFSRDRSLVGQSIASAALTAGEVYSLQASNNGAVGGAILIVNSLTSGSLSWLPPSISDAGIYPATVNYTLLGPLGARMEVVTTISGGNSQTVTNNCYLAYFSTNSGFSQGLIAQLYSPLSFGAFIRDQSLIGQQATSTQMAPGEMYEFVFTGPNPIFSNIVTLVVDSTASDLLFWQFPTAFSMESAGLSPVSLNYTQLGPRECQLEIIVPPTEMYPAARTNLCTLVYSATNRGLLQVAHDPQLTSGIFHRDATLVGQQLAPPQLTTGESYQIGTSNSVRVATDTLLVVSPTTGVLQTQGNGPEAGIFPNVSLRYDWINNRSARIAAVIPPGPPVFEARTNSYWFIYTTTNGGLVKRTGSTGESTFGRIQRQPSQ
jgi:hypothetical protein